MPWSWAAATRIGTSHLRNGSVCQDAHRCFQKDESLVLIVSDGAGSASEGGRGALLACRTMATQLSVALDAGTPDDEALALMVDAVRDRVAHVALGRGLAIRNFAATLVVVIATPVETIALHVGDGAAIVWTEEGWSALSWPESGEFASTTYFVTDDGGARFRISRLPYAVERIAVMTDGVERLALDMAAGVPHSPFFDGVMRPLASVADAGRSAIISAKLGAFLAGDAVNARTDDDKTLLLARRL